MRILLAFDKFKGTLSSVDVAQTVLSTLLGISPDLEIVQIPLADGGEGTLAIGCEFGYEPCTVMAADALGRPQEVTTAVRDAHALVEMAAICGISQIKGQAWDGQDTTSLGLGLAASQVLDRGVTGLTISVGGSASTDGGLGFICGLGAVGRDRSGQPVPPTLRGLESVVQMDLSSLHPRVGEVSWEFLVDVNTPLTGPTGAAIMFGPQKRLDSVQIGNAESALQRWAKLIEKISGATVAQVPGSGAAGGILTGALLICEPTVRAGVEFVAEITGLDEAMGQVDLVITGEGRLDEQSLHGKGPGYVLREAARRGVAAAVICGVSDLSVKDLHEAGLSVVAVSTTSGISPSVEAAMEEPKRWLAEATRGLTIKLEAHPEFPWFGSAPNQLNIHEWRQR